MSDVSDRLIRRYLTNATVTRAAGSASNFRFAGLASRTEHDYDIHEFGVDFVERIAAGAFARTLAANADVVLLINHQGLPLARTRSGTMTLTESSRGLEVEAELDPADPDVASVVPKMKRGDLDRMSIGFWVREADWNSDRSKVVIKEIDLDGGDVAIVTNPANPATSAELRRKPQVSADNEVELPDDGGESRKTNRMSDGVERNAEGAQVDAEGVQVLNLAEGVNSGAAITVDLERATREFVARQLDGVSLGAEAAKMVERTGLARDNQGGPYPFGWLAGVTGDSMSKRADVPTLAGQYGSPPVQINGFAGRVFKPLLMSSLGVKPVMVKGSDLRAVFVSGGPDATVAAEGAAVDAGAVTLAGTSMKPVRVTANAILSEEGMARFGGDSLAAAVVTDLELAVMDALDEQIINGSGTAPNMTGVFAALTAPDAPSTLATYEQAISIADDAIDGIYAESPKDVSVFIGVETAKYMAAKLRNGSDLSALEVLQRRAKEVRVTARVPDSVSGVQDYLTFGGLQGAVIYLWLWAGAKLIVDDKSQANAGKTRFTVNALAAVHVETAARSALDRGKLMVGTA